MKFDLHVGMANSSATRVIFTHDAVIAYGKVCRSTVDLHFVEMALKFLAAAFSGVAANRHWLYEVFTDHWLRRFDKSGIENPASYLGFQPARGAEGSRSPCRQLKSPRLEAA